MGDMGVASRQWDVPNDLTLKVGVKFDLVPCLREKDQEVDAIILMQHSEQRGVVLDGVGREYG